MARPLFTWSLVLYHYIYKKGDCVKKIVSIGIIGALLYSACFSVVASAQSSSAYYTTIITDKQAALAAEVLPYTGCDSPNYAATYIGAGGAYSRTPSILASSVYARINAASLKNMQRGEILVLHFWGKSLDGNWQENNIVIGGNQVNAAYVDFTIYISAYSSPWVKKITLPASHSFTLYIKTIYPSGAYYKRLEFSVYDITTSRSYTYQYALPATQVMDSADIALEKAYSTGEQRPGLVQQWRSVSQFRVYNQYGRLMDLVQSGFVTEWTTSGVQTAYYHDYAYYSGVKNSLGTFYLTRYPVNSAYPLHP